MGTPFSFDKTDLLKETILCANGCNPNPCHESEECVDGAFGGFDCVCPKGTISENGVCVGVNECEGFNKCDLDGQICVDDIEGSS